VARYWVSGPLITNEETASIIEQMVDMGADQAQIDAFKATTVPDECLVLLENRSAVSWFLDVSDFLNFSANGVALGIDVKAVQADADMSGKSFSSSDYNKLRNLGRYVCNELNKRK
jgi:hypothetical protein